MDELGRRIAELVAEAEANVTEAPKRTWYEATVGHPGFMTHRPKLPEQRLADLRRDYVLSRLGVEPRSEDERRMMRYMPGVYEAMQDYRNPKSPMSRESLQSPHQKTGLFGPGSGLHTGMQWAQSTVGMANNASHMLANATGDLTALALSGDPKMTGGYVKPYGEAARDFGRGFNTLTAPVQSLTTGALGITDLPSDWSAWSQADAARRSVADEDWTDLSGTHQALSGQLENAVAPTPTGYDLMQDYQIPELIGEVPARAIGVTMDSILNPLPPPLKAIRGASRAGQHGAAAWQLAKELAPGYALEGLSALPQPTPREPSDAEAIRFYNRAGGLRAVRDYYGR